MSYTKMYHPNSWHKGWEKTIELKGEIIMDWKSYERKPTFMEMTQWMEGMEIKMYSISDADVANGNPKPGGMIARDPKNHADMWYINPEFFIANYIRRNLPINPLALFR